MGKWATRDSDDLVEQDLVRKMRMIFELVKTKTDGSTQPPEVPLSFAAFVEKINPEDKLFRRFFEYLVKEERLAARRARAGVAVEHNGHYPRVLLTNALTRIKSMLDQQLQHVLPDAPQPAAMADAEPEDGPAS
eukprot:m.123434 g.123434  ORF g.123434 m.123434 type:complete len:134 (+) comp14622_c0_seq2:750-1151(+)